MKCLFTSPEFDAQFLRILSYIHTNGADLCECYQTAKNIHDGDIDSWYQEWKSLGDKVYSDAILSEREGNHISSKEAYFRASNYFLTSIQFLKTTQNESRLLNAYNLHSESFKKGIHLSKRLYKEWELPYEGTTLPVRLWKCNKEGPAPVLIVNQGYDGTEQSSYLALGKACMERDIHLVTFDGPGQGSPLFYDQLPMPNDWSFIISSIIDQLVQLKEVDADKISILGLGWGGMLASQACAKESRIQALITHPGQWDALQCIEKFIPEIHQKIALDESASINTLFGQAMTNKMISLKFKSRMLAHGVESPFSLVKKWQEYHLEHLIENITCKTLVIDAVSDPLQEGQAARFFDSLSCNKKFISLKEANGIRTSYETGASPSLQRILFDWLQNPNS
ncbi:esterase FrsA [Chlamydiales bacterium]|nr:esterase FrsA [Chlamydiales bacterium]